MEELIQYVKFKNVPDHLKTKTQLKEMGLKPINEECPDATVKAYVQGHWKVFNLYDITNTKEIKKRHVNELPITDKNIAEALYLINKSAKKSRDTKVINYTLNNHNVVKRSKNRELDLYDLKNRVILAALQKGIAAEVGYHTQKNLRTEREKIILCHCCNEEDWENEDDWEFECYCPCHEERRHYEIRDKEIEVINYFTLVKINDYTFHLPNSFENVQHLTHFGEIERISAEATRKVDITFTQAVTLLNRFLEDH